MTPKEAIEILRDTPIDIRSARDDDIHTLYATAQMMAMDALKKQTAVEPEYKGDITDSRGRIIDDTWVWICPTCGKEYEMDCDDYHHCPECGQVIRQKGETDEGQGSKGRD